MDASAASWEVGARCRRLSWLLHASVVEAKHAQLVIAFKAGFNPSQPRVPAGNPDGGEWTGSGGGGGSGEARPTQNPSSDHLTNIPKERPESARVRHMLVRQVAKHVARLALEHMIGEPAGIILNTLDIASWVAEGFAPYVESYADPPKSLEELQDAVSTPATGYDIHHVVEQTPAVQDGFPRSMIDAPDNLVRIPTFKHWELNAWYQTPNADYGRLSPRAYLRGKDWAERTRVGRGALIDHGILKP